MNVIEPTTLNARRSRAFADAPGRNRTFNLRIKSPLLCQLSYRGAATMVAAASGQPLLAAAGCWTPELALLQVDLGLELLAVRLGRELERLLLGQVALAVLFGAGGEDRELGVEVRGLLAASITASMRGDGLVVLLEAGGP